jgi:integrase
MSVTVRPYVNGGWEVDIRVQLPDGSVIRERKKAAASSKQAAQKWAESRERVLLVHGKPKPAKEDVQKVPTLKAFALRFLDGYAKANRLRPSGIASKETVLRVHLAKAVGGKRLDEISTEDVQRLKAALTERAPKTVNNVLTVLSVVLRTAVEWGVIPRVPCSIKLLKAPKSEASFHDFDEFERLVDVARFEALALLVVLLGGEAGLRCGEMMALEWTDIDFAKRRLTVARSEWKGHVTMPKGGRIRYVPMTKRLTDTLREARHLRGPRVLCDGQAAHAEGHPGAGAADRQTGECEAGDSHPAAHSVRTWLCEERQQGPSRNWLDTKTWVPRSATCTSAQRRSMPQFGYWRREPTRAARSWRNSGGGGKTGMKELKSQAGWLANRSAQLIEQAHLRQGYGGQPSPALTREGWWRRRESNANGARS